ncbi:MerR family DNA-binding protein [Beggiatoa alba]|nr:MerR family DNA-binding protein [Beggiatoa alba]
MNFNSITFTIGKLAAAAHVNVETIRYYQRLKLIPEPSKPAQGYRRYPAEIVSRVRFIKRTQLLGFTLKEIQELLNLGDGHCQQVQYLAEEKIHSIEERIADLKVMRIALKDFLIDCQATGSENTQCALIEAIVSMTRMDVNE